MFTKCWSRENYPKPHYNCDWIIRIGTGTKLGPYESLSYNIWIMWVYTGHLNWKDIWFRESRPYHIYDVSQRNCVWGKNKDKKQREKESKRERKKQLWLVLQGALLLVSLPHEVHIHSLPFGYRRHPFVFLILSSYLFKLVWLLLLSKGYVTERGRGLYGSNHAWDRNADKVRFR